METKYVIETCSKGVVEETWCKYSSTEIRKVAFDHVAYLRSEYGAMFKFRIKEYLVTESIIG